MLFRAVLMASAMAFSGGVVAPSYDYYIDDALGNDSNDGSSGSPWQSLSKVQDIALGAGATVDVLVKAGTYDKTTDYVIRNAAGGQPGAGSTLNITFETGCVMDGAAASASAETNGFELDGSNAWTCNVTGNGLIVQHYNRTSGGVSPNGVGCRGSVTVNVTDVRTTDCVDGFSAHGTSTLNLTDCEADACIKAPFIHVGSATVTALRSRFTELSGGGTSEMDICDTTFTGTITCTQCEFVPDGASSRFRAGGRCVQPVRAWHDDERPELTVDQWPRGSVDHGQLRQHLCGRHLLCHGAALLRPLDKPHSPRRRA